MQKTQDQSLGWEDPLAKGMATTPVFLPGEFYGQRSLASLPDPLSMGLQRIRRNWRSNTFTFFFSFIPHLDQYDRIESLRDLSLSTYIY